MEEYAQSLIDWMDGEGGYREWFSAQTASKGGGETSGTTGPGNSPPPKDPPPPPPPPGD